MAEQSLCHLLSFEGEIVEIFERGGQRVARIVLAPPMVCEVSAADLADAHLGDRVIVNGRVTIEHVVLIGAKSAGV